MTGNYVILLSSLKYVEEGLIVKNRSAEVEIFVLETKE